MPRCFHLELISSSYNTLKLHSDDFTGLTHVFLPLAGVRTPLDFVAVESRVAMANRLLAGASYLDLLDVHGIHKSTAYLCL